MAKQLNVNLAFKAETGQAKQAIMDLQSALSKVASMNINTPGLDANKLKAASSAAKELSIHLNNAFNAETGNFDLSKLDRSLKTSSTNVTELSSKLLGAGASGEQAFVKLAQSIAAADRPVVTLNSKLNEMLTTLKNTARWQISSSILHGFMGTIQQAYGYAQDLNESLNNIRIVTGSNIEQMSKFAIEANKAAKALSTTTTEYTNASLIYYQQGLSDAEVAKRTEVTVKMANAAGQSAQVVSDQLTAIWNNFYDGSKSLEYYADVMTALGAATASSTDEIAGGLEKFAAIGETIGLSYEYAASALATITSNTRQSEEVVGTALKTIFARIQGLNLGETLDDGTTLNKYSKALQSVGISIFDQAGELKNMDNILNEMADKWDTLSKAQQVALAQTVAGTRQYTQLVALMDNWDNGDNDSMTANLDTAYGATGALQEQADIYAESWEAARDRVTASLETIYNQLLDDEFFIDISNGFAGLLDSVSAFIDGIGGVKTILIAIGSIFLSSVANKIQPALMNLRHSFSVVFQSAEKQAQSLAGEMNKGIQDTLNSEIGKGFNDSNQVALKNAMALNSAKAKLQAVENGLNDSEKQRANLELSMIQMQQQETQEVADRITKLKQEKDAILDKEEASQLNSFGQDTAKQGSREIDSNVNVYKDAMHDAVSSDMNDASVDIAIEKYMRAKDAAVQYQETQQILIESTAEVDNAFRQMGDSLDLTNPTSQLDTLNQAIQNAFGGALTDLEQRLEANSQAIDENATSFISFRNQIDLAVASMPKAIRESEDMQEALADLFKAKDAKGLQSALQKVQAALKKSKIDAKDFGKVLEEVNPKRFKELQENANKTSRALKELEEKQNAVNRAIKNFEPKHTASKIETITKTAAGLGQVAMAAQSARSVFQAWGNDDLSFGEKLMTSLTGLSMAIPSAIGGLKSLNAALGLTTIAEQANAIMTEKMIATNFTKVASMKAEALAQQQNISLDTAQMMIARAKALVFNHELQTHKEKLKALTAAQLAEKLGISTDTAAIIVSKLKAGSTMAEALAEAGLTTAKGAGTAATIAQTIANWALQASMSPVLLITLLLVAAVAVLVGTIAAVVAIVNAATNAYNADAIAAENAATAAKNLGEAYNECKQEYQDMISTMENYKSARDALDDLTRGTEEYRQALKEANRQAIELINQYGLIEGQDYEWQGDELVIKDEAMNRVSREKEAEVDKAYSASQMANAEAKRTKAIADQTALRREIRDDNGVGNGDKIGGAIVNGLIAGVGMALAPVTGGLSLLATGAAFANQTLMENKSSAYDAAINKAIEEGKTNQKLWTDKETMAKELELNDQDLIDALWENRDSIQQLSADINAADAAAKVAAQNAANELMDGKGYNNTEAGKMAMEAGGEIYQQMYDDAYKKYKTGKKTSEDDFKRYAEESGLSDLKNFKIEERKSDGSVEYSYLDEQGQEQKATATQEEIAAMLAAADAAGKLEGALSQLRGTISTLNNSKDLGDHALAEFLSTGNMEGATKAEFDDIRNDVGYSKDAAGNITYDSAKVNSVLGLTGDATKDLEIAKSRGYESADAYRQAFIDSLDIDWEVPSNLSQDLADKLTVGAAQKIQSTFEEMGEKGGQVYLDTINGIASGADWDALSLEDQTAMLDELANIDWSSWDAGEQAIEIADKYGIAIDGTTLAWQNNINAMRDVTNALPDLQAMREEYEQIKEITSDIDLGSILSEEDYKTLVNYNSELERYFTILSDGSAQFIGDKLDFQQEIETQHTKELLEAIQAYKDRNAEIEAQIKAGENAVGGSEKLDQYRDSENYVGNDGKNYYSGGNVNKQLEFLKSQGYDSAQITEWEQDLSDGNTTISTLEAIASAVNDTADSFNNLGVEASENEALIQGMMNELALSAESAAERAELLESGLIDAEAYGYAAMAAHNEEKWEGMDPDEVEDYAESLMEAADASDLLSDELKDNEEAAEDVALYTKKMNKGIEALSEGFEGWSDVLQNSDKASEEYSEAMHGVKSAMSDVLGVSEDFLSDDFILNNMEDIKLAAEGDAAAIDRLAIAAAQDILVNVGFEDEGVKAEVMALHNELAGMVPDIEVGATLDDGDFLSKAAQVVETAGMTVEEANAYFRALGFEPHFETKTETVTTRKPRTRTHTDYALSSSSVGFDLGPFGKGSFSIPTFDAITSSWNEGYTDVTETVEVPALTTDGGKPSFSLTRTNSGAMNNSSGANRGNLNPSSGGGGGGSSSAPSTITRRDSTSESEIVERYREVNDAIDNVTDALTRAERATDRLWGKAKFDAMREENKILREQYELLQEKARQAEQYARTDATNLRNVAEEIGVSVVIDPDTGDITNIEDVEKTLHERLAAAEDAYNQKVDAYNAEVKAAGDNPTEEKIKELETMKEAIEAYEKDIIGGIEDDIDAWEEAEQQFKDSIETWEEAGLSAEEIMDQIMQNNFDIWSEGLELNIEVNSRELEALDYYLSKIENDVYSMAEAAAYMVGSLEGLNSGKFGGQLAAYLDSLSTYQSSLDNLNTLLANGEITEAAYQEGLESIRSGLLDNLQSLNELDDAMLNYYGDTLSMVTEEIGKYTEKMEHQSSVLEHYSNMMSILGKEQDYDSMGTILQGQADILADQVDVAKAEYDLYTQEAANKRKLYEDAIAAGDQAAAEVYKKEWEAADEAAMEAQSNMLDKTEEWAESMKAVVENKLAGLAQSLESALTGGTSFDELTTSLERAASLQEEYLTTTNQIYETNKLMRTAQQEIDKTTNTVAKQRLKDFVKETDQLQDKSKLSQYELEIQQAKYDLLLAEIALEEAQSAKSTVRLQRDAEGNFGYVYTADQDQLANAQQELEDAQNSLYNIGLEGANEYTEKYAQTMQEMYDTLTSIQEAWLNGEIATQEEYDRQMLAAQEYYYQQLEDYSSLYSVAISTDSRVVKDAWSSGFNSMMSKTNEWKDKVNQYSAEARETLVNWYAKVDEIANKTGLDNIASKVKAVTDESKALKDAVIGEDGKGGVVQALKDELTAVSNLTGGYASLRGTIQGLISDYEVLMGTVNNAQNQQTSTNQTTENGDGDSGDGNTGGNTGNNTGGNTGSDTGGNNTGGNATPTLVKGQDVTVKTTATHFSRDGGNGTLMKSFVPGSTYSVMDLQGEEVLIGRGGVATGWVRKTDLVGFNTGGYTGEWGPYGKLAILDEKELVLNKNDTANFLASMELLEHILEMIDLHAASAQLGGMLTSPGYAETQTETIEQNVHIEASFPAVQDRNEIEEAFNTLINRASQYANRK